MTARYATVAGLARSSGVPVDQRTIVEVLEVLHGAVALPVQVRTTARPAVTNRCGTLGRGEVAPVCAEC